MKPIDSLIESAKYPKIESIRVDLGARVCLFGKGLKHPARRIKKQFCGVQTKINKQGPHMEDACPYAKPNPEHNFQYICTHPD